MRSTLLVGLLALAVEQVASQAGAWGQCKSFESLNMNSTNMN